MDYPFNFDADKAIESVLYILQQGTNPTFLHISKVMYFADREHLEKYGRFICGDNYVAMKRGPVPSRIYDLLKILRGDTLLFNLPNSIVANAQSSLKIKEKYNVHRLRDANLDFFSDSDLKCLDQAVKDYGNLSSEELTNLSHDQAWQSANENDFIEIEDIVTTLNNANELMEHLQDQHPGDA